MLKLNASYSKKVPADQDYSSQSYHASVEIEMPDGLTQEQLQTRIHQTFALVRDSVESELNGNGNGKSNGNGNGGHTVPVQVQVEKTVEAKANVSNGNETGNGNGQKKAVVLASQKQVKFLLDLARNCQINIGKVLAKYGVDNANDLDKESCSKLINEIKSTGATA